MPFIFRFEAPSRRLSLCSVESLYKREIEPPSTWAARRAVCGGIARQRVMKDYRA
jgi:hypothetical protein